jgi:hypothetical protein
VNLPAPSRIHIIRCDLDVEQERVALPTDYVLQQQYSTVEIWERPGHVIELKFVNPKTLPNQKRYKLVEHKRSYLLSLPRPWLKNRLARTGDLLTVHIDNGQLYIQWRGDLRAHAALIATAPRIGNGELTPRNLVDHLRLHSVQFGSNDPLGRV